MSYIIQDLRTMNALKIWSETKHMELFVPTFFFWSAGTLMKRSTSGLLRSLVHQIAKRSPKFIPALVELNNVQNNTEQYPAWTERRLIATLHYLIA